MSLRSKAARLVGTTLALATLAIACAHQAERVPFNPANVSKKPDSWKCFEAKLPMESSARSQCYGDGGECEQARAKFATDNPQAASVGACGLETKAFCFQWAQTEGSALLGCAKTNEECELQATSKAEHAPLFVKVVSSCSSL